MVDAIAGAVSSDTGRQGRVTEAAACDFSNSGAGAAVMNKVPAITTKMNAGKTKKNCTVLHLTSQE